MTSENNLNGIIFNIIISKGTWNHEDGIMDGWNEGRMEEKMEGEKKCRKCQSRSQWCISQLSYRIRAAVLNLGSTALSQGSHIRYLTHQIFILGFITVT